MRIQSQRMGPLTGFFFFFFNNRKKKKPQKPEEKTKKSLKNRKRKERFPSPLKTKQKSSFSSLPSPLLLSSFPLSFSPLLSLSLSFRVPRQALPSLFFFKDLRTILLLLGRMFVIGRDSSPFLFSLFLSFFFNFLSLFPLSFFPLFFFFFNRYISVSEAYELVAKGRREGKGEKVENKKERGGKSLIFLY